MRPHKEERERKYRSRGRTVRRADLLQTAFFPRIEIPQSGIMEVKLEIREKRE